MTEDREKQEVDVSKAARALFAMETEVRCETLMVTVPASSVP